MRITVHIPDVSLLDRVVSIIEKYGGEVIWTSETGLVIVAEVPSQHYSSVKRELEGIGASVRPEVVYGVAGFFHFEW